MKHVKQSFFNNEKGMTLIEVLASIVILTIIVTSLLTIFLQSTKATQTSSNTIDATYLAQKEMENMYALSREIKYDELDVQMTKKGNEDEGVYTKVTTGDDSKKYTKENIVNNHLYQISVVTEIENTHSLVRVIVKITEPNQPNNPLAQMENLLEWGMSDED